MGKTTCLTADFGASGVRIVPVYDGFSLMNCYFFLLISSIASFVSPYGGDYMNQLLHEKLQSQKIQVIPHCFLKKHIFDGIVTNIQKVECPNIKASFVKYAIMVFDERHTKQ